MVTLEEKIKELEARISQYEQGVQADQILHSIATNSPSNIMVLDIEGHIQYINHTVPGITPDEILGLRVPDIVEEEYKAGIVSALERCAQSGKPDRYETSYTSPSGDTSWWDCGVGPVFQGQKVTSFVVVSTNITEQRRKQQEQQRFFNLSVDLMCIADVEGNYQWVNQAFYTTLGYNETELLNRHYLEFVHPDDIDITVQQFERILEGEVIRDFDNRYRAAGGNYRLFSWRAHADHKNNVMYAVARDITETKHLEEQLQQSRRLEALGQLAGGIAHDFNNLLGVIQGNVELALLSPKLTESSLNNALAGTSRAASLTKQLLVFSRHQNLSPEVINLTSLLDNLIGLLQQLLPENISITLEHEESSLCVFADKTQLEQVIINLCLNARDSMAGGGKLDLSVEKASGPEVISNQTSAPPAGYLKLTVSDTGCGMTPDVQTHIFEPFYTTKEVGKGSGLGLATVYAIVKQHEGFLETESAPDVGSTFRVYLPRTTKALADTTEPTKTEAAVKGGEETILVAEDDPMVRTTVTLILNQAGYRVLTANDGLDAVRLFQENTDEISLVLLDVVMPNLGGLDAAEQIRLTNPNVNILFTSGYLQNHQGSKQLENEKFITKPYRIEKLLSYIRDTIDSNAKVGI